MKNSINIGDLVLCRTKANLHFPKGDDNYKIVIGWVTDYAPLDHPGGAYYIHWSDQEKPSLTTVNSAMAVRDFYLNKRAEWGI